MIIISVIYTTGYALINLLLGLVLLKFCFRKNYLKQPASIMIITGFLLGQGVLASLWLILVIAGMLKFKLVMIISVLILITGLFIWSELVEFVKIILVSLTKQLKELTWIWKFILFLIMVLILYFAIGSLILPLHPDAEGFYMVLPKVLAYTGKLFCQSSCPDFSVGLLGEMHSAVLMIISDLSAAKFFVWFDALATAGLLISLGTQIGLKARGKVIILALLFTSRTFVNYIYNGKPDIYGAVFGLAAYYWTLKMKGNRLAQILTGLFTGFAVVAKLSNILVIVPGIFIMFCWIYWDEFKNNRKNIKSIIQSVFLSGLTIILSFGLAFSSNMVKNKILFNDPFSSSYSLNQSGSWSNPVWQKDKKDLPNMPVTAESTQENEIDGAVVGKDTNLIIAQSFRLDKPDYVSAVSLYLKNNSAIDNSGQLTVKIESDNGKDEPSGNLVDLNAIKSIRSYNNTYQWETVNFDPPLILYSDTLYWIVAEGTKSGEDTGYILGTDGNSSTYTKGFKAVFTNGMWDRDLDTDLYFKVYTDKGIEGYLPPDGRISSKFSNFVKTKMHFTLVIDYAKTKLALPWLIVKNTFFIFYTSPLAFTLWNRPGQDGTLSILVLIFLPFFFWRGQVNLVYRQILIMALTGVILWLLIRSDVIHPRYILATLLLFLPIIAYGIEKVFVEKKSLVLQFAIIGAILTVLGCFIVTLSYLPKDFFQLTAHRIKMTDLAGNNYDSLNYINKNVPVDTQVLIMGVFPYYLKPEFILTTYTVDWTNLYGAIQYGEGWSFVAQYNYKYVVFQKINPMSIGKVLENSLKPDRIKVEKVYSDPYADIYSVEKK